MKSDFHYDLPEQLIAQFPPVVRGTSRLLEVGADRCRHREFDGLTELVRPGDLLVVNDTRVIKARLMAVKDSGGAAEILVERVESECLALCQVKVSKSLKQGRLLHVGDLACEVQGRSGEFYRLLFPQPVLDVLETHGQMPLPPYIQRNPEDEDAERYQTVYSASPGAIAAPTAGLHFTPELLDALRDRGARIAEVTLHVGAGTFQPVRADRIEDHRLHEERYCVPEATAAAIARTAASGGRVVAVGTTVVRTLEAANAGRHRVRSGWGATDLFIREGYEFKVVDALVTNFHLPESSLLMLVCAFAGHDRVMAAYRQAVAAGYRFFSYGDAMWLTRETGAPG
ncbi:MAG: tRNA preQ1(34) S-adenosylmethionine ribosyltransferase-isomerase QueA [Pseudomonadales bacterium]|nr:tRNA preQ1(34) S-adenosylmethionine ribosyltransferase-isomerase QueA [Pseudomonadales bacterium]